MTAVDGCLTGHPESVRPEHPQVSSGENKVRADAAETRQGIASAMYIFCVKGIT